MPPEGHTTIIGLVGAVGAAAGNVGQSNDWLLVFDLVGWRYPGSEVVVEGRRCELTVPEDEVEALMDRVGPYKVVEVEIGDGSTVSTTVLSRIVHIGGSDPELEELAGQLRTTIVLHDDALGRLEYDRARHSFLGRIAWAGQDVRIVLESARPDDAAGVLEATRRLVGEQAEWHRRVGAFAVERLLILKNQSWLDEDESELSAAEFRSRMTLEAISVAESGDFTFWHDDGGLFDGHTIEIGGQFDEGLTNAGISG